MPDLPSGTVTFLFTDIEGSTALWERDREAMAVAVARHIALLDAAVQAHGRSGAPTPTSTNNHSPNVSGSCRIKGPPSPPRRRISRRQAVS